MLTVAGGKYTTFRAIADNALFKVYRLLGKRPAHCETSTTPLMDRRPQQSGQQLTTSPAVFESDIIHACRAEKAVTLSDVMRRRTRLALSPFGGAEVAESVNRIMSAELNWDSATQQTQLKEYLEDRDRSARWAGNKT